MLLVNLFDLRCGSWGVDCRLRQGYKVAAHSGLPLTHKKEGPMDAIRRVVVLGVVVTLGVVLGAGLGHVAAQASNPRLGTWKLNVEKSKYNPGPAPQSTTRKIE